MSRYIQRYDGDKIPVKKRGHLIRCCDCGLVHLLKFQIDGSTITMRPYRLPKQTAASRRGKKYRGLRLPRN